MGAIHYDMKDSLKNVVDSLTTKLQTVDNIDYLNQIDSFYNSAWDKLVLTGSIVIGLVGIVVPILIQFWQQRNLETQERNLKGEIETQIAKAKEELKVMIEDLIKKEVDSLGIKQQESFDNIEGKLLQTQGNLFYDKDNKSALHSYIRAARQYLKGNNGALLVRMLAMTSKTIKTFKTEEELRTAEDYLNFKIADLIVDVSQSKFNVLCENEIIVIKQAIKNIGETNKTEIPPGQMG